jgi:hypothetical protein
MQQIAVKVSTLFEDSAQGLGKVLYGLWIWDDELVFRTTLKQLSYGDEACG